MNWPKVIRGSARYSADCSDAIAFLRSLPDDGVDLMVTSPPYENRREYDDVQFDLEGEDWVRWMVGVVTAAAPKVTGPIVVNCEGKTEGYSYSAVPFLLLADLKRAGFTVRKPAVYRRNGIMGSGGPDYLRNDWEPVLVVTRPGRLPWSDNTACGHPPKYGPGGPPSHRTIDGTRVNAKNTSRRRLDKTEPQVAAALAGEVALPAGSRLQLVPTAGGEFRTKLYRPPALANPGNVIECEAVKVAPETVLAEVIRHGCCTQTRPDQTLQALRQAVFSQDLRRWVAGIRYAIRAALLLRPDLHGFWTKDCPREVVSQMCESLSATNCQRDLLFANLFGSFTGASVPAQRVEESQSKAGKKTEATEPVREMRGDRQSASPPQGRKPVQQLSVEPSEFVPAVSHGASPAQDAEHMLRVWAQSGETVSAIWNSLRHALPSVQEAWLAVPDPPQDEWWSHADDRISDVINCGATGGGHMGGKLAHLNEAPFPVQLPTFFIRSFCPPNGIVLDPFAGSGTTVKAALDCGRRAVSCDLRPEMVDLIHRRAVGVTRSLLDDAPDSDSGDDDLM